MPPKNNYIDYPVLFQLLVQHLYRPLNYRRCHPYHVEAPDWQATTVGFLWHHVCQLVGCVVLCASHSCRFPDYRVRRSSMGWCGHDYLELPRVQHESHLRCCTMHSARPEQVEVTASAVIYSSHSWREVGTGPYHWPQKLGDEQYAAPGRKDPGFSQCYSIGPRRKQSTHGLLKANQSGANITRKV